MKYFNLIKKHKFKLEIIAVIALVVLVVLYVYGVHRINSKFRYVKEERYLEKEAIECDGLVYRVTGQSVIDYPYEKDNEGKEPQNEKVLCINVVVKNNSDEVKDVDFTFVNIEYNYMSQAYSLYLFANMNKSLGTSGLTLNPGSVYNITLPYEIFSFSVDGDYSNVEKYPCNLVFNIYPVKKYYKVF